MYAVIKPKGGQVKYQEPEIHVNVLVLVLFSQVIAVLNKKSVKHIFISGLRLLFHTVSACISLCQAIETSAAFGYLVQVHKDLEEKLSNKLVYDVLHAAGPGLVHVSPCLSFPCPVSSCLVRNLCVLVNGRCLGGVPICPPLVPGSGGWCIHPGGNDSRLSEPATDPPGRYGSPGPRGHHR